MKHKLPEDLAALSREALAKLLDDLTAEWSDLIVLSDDEIEDSQLDDLEEISAAIDTVKAQIDTVDAEASSRAERLAAQRSRQAAASDEDGDDEEESEGEEDAEGDEEEGEESEEPAEEAEKKEPVMASGKPAPKRRSVVARMHASTVVAKDDEDAPRAKTAIVAAADVPGYASGATIIDFRELSKAYGNRAKGFTPSPSLIQKAQANPERWQRAHANDGLRRFGLAQIRKPENEFALEMGMSIAEQFEVLDRLLDERRLPGGNLVASGGWCAPSETVYDFGPRFATVDGIFSIPEVNINRGGINFSTGPDYSSLAADWGFLQTEAQAEAGTEKVCYEITCPDFADHRLDAIGFCVSAGILTNVGYPELIQEVLQLGAIAHQHKVNFQKISRVQTLLGTAIAWTPLNSGVADLLNALELNAEVIRYKLSMAVGATMEVVLPAWARLIARQDIAVRNGGTPADALGVTDQQINAWFAVRKMNVQWVYDWQPLTVSGAGTGTAMPTTVDAMIYPAGTFFAGGTPVIDLDAVYDSVGLSTNTYNAAFFEEGILVAQRGGAGARVTVPLNYRGATGFPAVGAGEGVTFAAAA